MRRASPKAILLLGVVVGACLTGPAAAQSQGGMDPSWTEAPSQPSSGAQPAPPTVTVVAAAPPAAPADTMVVVAPPPEVPRKRSPGMIAAGGVLTGVGVINAIAGLALYMIGSFDRTTSTMAGMDHRSMDRNDRTAGEIMMVGGAGLVALGIPLLVIGIRKRPVEQEPALAPSRFVASRSGIGVRF